MKKILCSLPLLAMLFTSNLNAENKDNKIEAIFTIENEKNTEIKGNGIVSENSEFTLKMAIPDEWKVYSNEQQSLGKSISFAIHPMKIELNTDHAIDTPTPVLNIQYPQSKDDRLDSGKMNHVYTGTVEFKIEAKNYEVREKSIVIDYTMCNKKDGRCLNNKTHVSFGSIKPSVITEGADTKDMKINKK